MDGFSNQSEIQSICNWLVRMGIVAAYDNQTVALARRFFELGADMEELNSFQDLAQVEAAASDLFSDAKDQSNFVQKVCRAMNIRIAPMVSLFHVRCFLHDKTQTQKCNSTVC